MINKARKLKLRGLINAYAVLSRADSVAAEREELGFTPSKDSSETETDVRKARFELEAFIESEL